MSKTFGLGDTCQAAAATVCVERMQDYGLPSDTLSRVAEITNILLDKKLVAALDASDIAVVMCVVKLVREQHHHKPDNLVDLTAYADIINTLRGTEEP